jgi:methylmalonyl-CoA/ethylmalonyl-CoA epimerase
MITGVHHLTVVVRDLDQAVERWKAILDCEPIFEERFALGNTWLALVAPYDPQGVPGRHLAQHGEGLLLVSLSVDSLDQTQAALADRGVGMRGPARKGVDGWSIHDLESDLLGAVTLQLCEDRAPRT